MLLEENSQQTGGIRFSILSVSIPHKNCSLLVI